MGGSRCCSPPATRTTTMPWPSSGTYAPASPDSLIFSERERGALGRQDDAHDHGGIVAAGRDQHQAVPDGIVIAEASPQMNGDAQAVEQAADDQKQDRRRRDLGEQRSNGNHDGPAQQ